jgi:hypothetical protein
VVDVTTDASDFEAGLRGRAWPRAQRLLRDRSVAIHALKSSENLTAILKSQIRF